jgi:hypothetical protein
LEIEMSEKTYTLRQQKANRKLWVKALRSGKYKQGTKVLRSADNAFCCLGVLCAVAGMRPKLEGEYYRYGSEYNCAPKKAMASSGCVTTRASFTPARPGQAA